MRIVSILLALTLITLLPLALNAEEQVEDEFVWDGVTFDLENFDGDDFTEEDIFTGGDLYLVDFWASWCRPCSQYLPHLASMMEEYEGRGLKVVIFCIDNASAISTAKARIGAEDYPFPILLDTEAEVKDDLGVRDIPTTILFNAEGEELWRHGGNSSGVEDTVREKIEEYLPPECEE